MTPTDGFRWTARVLDGSGRPRDMRIGTTGGGRVKVVAPEGFTMDPDETDTVMYLLEAAVEKARDEQRWPS